MAKNILRININPELKITTLKVRDGKKYDRKRKISTHFISDRETAGLFPWPCPLNRSGKAWCGG
ncbi:MAG: hypothetical protein ACQ9MH_22725 [Nitrospinales bacterium]